jgi:hypothetical protein
MSKRRSEHREPTHDWQQIQPLLKDTAQINDEVIRPVILLSPCGTCRRRTIVLRHLMIKKDRTAMDHMDRTS